jgi:hypothetical protein
MYKYWEVEILLTNDLTRLAEEWHSENFPRCKASWKMNNQCNHYRCFLAGYRAHPPSAGANLALDPKVDAVRTENVDES